MEKKIEVKELIELLRAIKLIGGIGGAIFADGKINASDFQHLTTLATGYQTIVEGVMGIGEVGDEIKDLDAEEVTQILTELAGVINHIRSSLKSPEGLTA